MTWERSPHPARLTGASHFLSAQELRQRDPAAATLAPACVRNVLRIYHPYACSGLS